MRITPIGSAPTSWASSSLRSCASRIVFCSESCMEFSVLESACISSSLVMGKRAFSPLAICEAALLRELSGVRIRRSTRYVPSQTNIRMSAKYLINGMVTFFMSPESFATG